MTKNEILEYFKDINHVYNDCTRYDTLKRMLDELQGPCDDAISRQEVLNCFKKWEPYLKGDSWSYSFGKELSELPPVTPAEKVGQWIDGKCNRCGTHAPFWAMASTYYCSEYCPKCGTKMQEVEE